MLSDLSYWLFDLVSAQPMMGCLHDVILYQVGRKSTFKEVLHEWQVAVPDGET